MDDLYAVVRALENTEMNIVGLTSSHFNNVQLLTDDYWHIYSTDSINTVDISQELNEKILDYLNRKDIPHPIGCDRIVGYSWGYYEGAPIPESPAVEFIIKTANEYSENDKINIVCLGAVTNIAAAILNQPAIAKNIRLYILSMKLTTNNAWDKNTFNARNDINALDLILNNKALELLVMPGNVSRTLVFQRDISMAKLSKRNDDLSKRLAKRWDEVNAGNTWIMWDLALIESIISPEVVNYKFMMTPPENEQRRIKVFTKIDAKKIESKFWNCFSNIEH